MHDVIVVGAGPVGCFTAERLAAAGHSVLVLERHSGIGQSVCTGIIGRECVDKFGIDESVILRNADSAHLYPPSGEGLYIRREEPQACIIDRAAFDNLMADRARQAGAEIRFESRVKNIHFDVDRALVFVSRRGVAEAIPARAAVVAAGFAPGLIGRLGLGTYSDYTVGAQADVSVPGLEEVEVYFGDVAPGFFAWLVPTTPPLARAGLLSRGKPGALLRRWLERLAWQGKIESAEVDIDYGAIPLRPLRRTSGARLIVVGDAAGQVKPLSGGGIYYGLLCADIAATVLHEAILLDDLSARRLARYRRNWRRRLARELQIGYWARRLYERMGNRQVNRIFRTVRERRIDEAILKARDVSFDWHGRTVLRLLRYKLIAGSLDIVRQPFRVGRIDR